MTTLTAVLTHVKGPIVDEQLGLLSRIAPDERFVVCHGGARADYESVTIADKVFIDDATLRGAPRSYQSYDVTLTAIWEAWVAADASVEAVYLIEYDHLVLRPDFATALAAVARETGAAVLGKTASVRNATNWEHYGRFRHDGPLAAHLRSITVRDDPRTMYGMLGDGMWLSRAALASYAAVVEHPPCYGELYVPTLLYHLGHRICDLDTVTDLYAQVRWDPAYTVDEVRALATSGATFVHPVKDLAAWREVASVPQRASEASLDG